MIENLQYEVMTDDVKKLFSICGEIKEAKVLFDRSGRSIGKAIVVYTSASEAQSAIEKFNKAKVDDQEITVKLVERREERDQRPSFRPKGTSSGGRGTGIRVVANSGSRSRKIVAPRDTAPRRGRRGGKPGSGSSRGGGGGRKPEIDADALDKELELYKSARTSAASGSASTSDSAAPASSMQE